jgi:FSR family fosmidomycin resistance protein-like MFS transporter
MSVLSVAWIGTMIGVAGLVRNYVVLAVVVGLGALGSAAFHPPGAIIAASSSGTRRGVAVSVFSMGGTLGSALSPLFITAGMAWFGTSTTLLLIPLTLLFGAVLSRQLRQVKVAKATRGAAGRNRPSPRALLGLALIVLTVMCLAWLQITLRTYLLIWFQSLGHSLSRGGRMFFVFLAAGGVGSLLGGPVSDRVGRWPLLLACLAVLAPAVYVFVGTTGIAEWLLVFTIGMLVGATFPVSIVLAQESWPGGIGIASGLVMGVGWLPGGIGASVTGLLADRFSLAVALRWLAAPVLLGAIFVTIYAALQRARSRHAPVPVLDERS